MSKFNWTIVNGKDWTLFERKNYFSKLRKLKGELTRRSRSTASAMNHRSESIWPGNHATRWQKCQRNVGEKNFVCHDCIVRSASLSWEEATKLLFLSFYDRPMLEGIMANSLIPMLKRVRAEEYSSAVRVRTLLVHPNSMTFPCLSVTIFTKLHDLQKLETTERTKQGFR